MNPSPVTSATSSPDRPEPSGEPTNASCATSTLDEERQICRDAVAGDPTAFAALYSRSRAIIHRYLLRRVNGDFSLADDLTAETFIRAFTRIGSYQDMGRPFVAWLLTIATNLVADHYKSGWRRLQVPWGSIGQDVDAGNSLLWIDTADPVDALVVDNQYRGYLRGAITAAMSELTDWQQQIIQMRYFEGLSVKDTALKLDTHEGAVKAATYRAIRMLSRDPRLQLLKTDARG